MNNFRKYFSESTLSLILGVLVVLVLGLVAYKIFKGRNVVPTELTQKVTEVSTPSGELTSPTASVALPVEHTVTAGETLWSIAQRYYTSGYNWVDISKANGIKNGNKIAVGQKLTIPEVSVRKPVAVSQQVTVTPVVKSSAISTEKYTVLKGDSLWSVSVRAYGDGFRWKEIASANKLVNPRLIHAGNVLTIPRP